MKAKNTTTQQPHAQHLKTDTNVESPSSDAQAKANAKKEKTALNFINPEKFIVQNNFIPVPSILMGGHQTGGVRPLNSG